MADNIIKVTVSSSTKKNVTVSSANVGTEITASSDTGKFWAQTSKNWAVSETIVDNTDYSSKYYANKAKESANIAQSNVGVCGDIYNSVQEVSQTVFQNIDIKSQEAVTNINNAKTEAVDSINNTKTNIITDIEFVADGEKQEIQGLVDDEKEEIKDLIDTGKEELKESIGDIKILTTLEIGDIGFTQMAIDETKGKRRVLNGQLIIQDQYQQFTNIIKNSVALNPDLACTEEEWQTAVTMSANGVCEKFVIDDEAGTIRLPKYPTYLDLSINGAKSVSVYGSGLGLSFTNGTNNFGSIQFNDKTYGLLFSGPAYGKKVGYDAGQTDKYSPSYTVVGITPDPTKSGLTGSVDTESEQIKGTYFIQVATGAETEDNITNAIELNNPFSLLDYKYSEYELNNLSWLRSQGQYNSKAIYPAVYDLLLKIYNGTETKTGVSVKLSTEDFTDYDFVLNTAEKTFRLPIQVQQKFYSGGDVPVAGSGMALGFTNGSVKAGTALYNQYQMAYQTANYGKAVGSVQSLSNPATANYQTWGVTTDPSKSGLVAKLSQTENTKLMLYFYVGETVQNANLINAGRIEEKITNALAKPHIVETYVNGASWYRVYSDGWCEQGGSLMAKAGTNTSVSLLKEYANTNYQVQLTYNQTETGATNGTQSAVNLKTTTSFAIGSQGGQTAWFAYGYIN